MTEPARRASVLLLAIILATAPGCFPARYLTQAASGEYGILHAARPNATVIQDPEVPGRIRRLVASVRSIKAFGESQGLRSTGSYGRYADLHRPAAVWLVQACAPLSFEVRRWSFPVVGSLPYVGWFDRSTALAYALSVEHEEALDVDVRAASAYSTLGWIHDPVLSTMIPDGDEALGELANVVLHESVHATAYIRDQSAFNESLASFVADRLTAPWLASVLGPRAPELIAWERANAAHEARLARLHATYDELDALYGSTATDEEKRATKARIVEALRVELEFRRPINNATLAGFRTYGTGFAEFDRLFHSCDQNWRRLLRAVARLTPEDFAERQQERFEPVVDRLSRGGCR